MKPLPTPDVILIGCGHVGRALLQTWQAVGLQPAAVIQPSLSAQQLFPQLTFYQTLAELPKIKAVTAVLAVRPQQASALMPALRALAPHSVISTMARVSLSWLAAHSGTENVARVMPALATPAIKLPLPAIATTPHAKQTTETLFATSATILWLEQETQLDSAVPLYGSAPAYIAWLLEQLETAMHHAGIPTAQATVLARGVLQAAMARLNHESPQTLQQQVATPGGITAAVLDSLATQQTAAQWQRALACGLAAAHNKIDEKPNLV